MNEEQLAAIRTRKGRISICAVPGSGKTTVFVARARQIIEGLLSRGLPVTKFLGLTFTSSAAKEMESRAKYVSGPDKPKIFRTFHGWALNFATQEYQNFPFTLQPRPLLLGHDQYKILAPIIKQMDQRPKYKDLQGYISQMKRRDVSPARAVEEADNERLAAWARAYGQYESKCRHVGKLDFDSLMSESVRVLDTRPDILNKWAPEFLQCDEAQDNDAIQWRLIQLLGRQNVFVVGDPEQNMYTWRGSEAEGLTSKFAERFPGAVSLPLSINYRSTGAIIAYLKEISPAWASMNMRSALGWGKEPTFKRYADENTEAERILMGLRDSTETAILARTNRQLAAFEKAAGKMELKYKLLGKSGFFSQPEVEFTVAFAQYCVGGANNDCIKKIIKSPYDDARFIKKHEAIETLESMVLGTVGKTHFYNLIPNFRSGDSQQDGYIRNLFCKLNETRCAIAGKSSQDALRCITTTFGILRHYEDDEDAIDNNQADNVMALLRMAEKKSSLLDFVQMCQRAKMASRSTSKRLTFATIHAAKGLEWKYVYVVGVNDGVLPHKDGDPEEECRIYRVACSRPALELEVSCNDLPSSFIKHKITEPTVGAVQQQVDLLEQMYLNAAQGSV